MTRKMTQRIAFARGPDASRLLVWAEVCANRHGGPLPAPVCFPSSGCPMSRKMEKPHRATVLTPS